MKIEFVLVNAANLDQALTLHTAEFQAGMVETVEECYEEAQEVPLWRPVIILADGVMVGFAMYGLWLYEGDRGRVWLDRFFIDERFQGRGYAKAVLPPLLEHIAAEYGYCETYLSVYETNTVAIRLYQGFGFAFNGELDINGEKVMVLRSSSSMGF